MHKVGIRAIWDLHDGRGGRLPARLVELLRALHAGGSLAAACRGVGLSYRYGWGLLREGQSYFGAPLVRAMRGRGARLTPLGERLVWADQRIAARLSPAFESLATELEAELQRHLSLRVAAVRVHASHGFAVEALRRALAADEQPLDLKYRSPDDALSALRTGACDFAGLHLPVGELEAPLAAHYRDRLDLDRDRVVHLAMRRQGLVVAPGNPKRLRALADLVDPGVRFIHRQPGSGSRLLLEEMLAREGIAVRELRGCDVEELTHAAVAAYVASGLADAGFALEPPARRYGLDFVPMVTEHYFLLCDVDTLDDPGAAALLALLRDGGFRREIGLLPGYDPSWCGTVQTLPEAFASLRA